METMIISIWVGVAIMSAFTIHEEIKVRRGNKKRAELKQKLLGLS